MRPQRERPAWPSLYGPALYPPTPGWSSLCIPPSPVASRRWSSALARTSSEGRQTDEWVLPGRTSGVPAIAPSSVHVKTRGSLARAPPLPLACSPRRRWPESMHPSLYPGPFGFAVAVFLDGGSDQHITASHE
eukprot:scaffold38594_cov348-Isochrysis_galbana.AAC.1